MHTGCIPWFCIFIWVFLLKNTTFINLRRMRWVNNMSDRIKWYDVYYLKTLQYIIFILKRFSNSIHNIIIINIQGGEKSYKQQQNVCNYLLFVPLQQSVGNIIIKCIIRHALWCRIVQLSICENCSVDRKWNSNLISLLFWFKLNFN